MDDVRINNSMISNMITVDEQEERKKEHLRRLNDQNNQFLRVQMKQRKQAEQFSTKEGVNFKTNWDYSAPVESYESLERSGSL